MMLSVAAGRREELIEADFQFHYAIIKSSENALFDSLYSTLRSFLHDEITNSQNDYDDPAQICDEHRQLITAFESSDAAVATTVYKRHIDNIKIRLRSQAAKGTD